jgi:hypothetical protein
VIGLQLLPVVFSLIVLGAHFMRAGNFAMLALVFVVLGLLGVRRPLAARLVQTALVLGAIEWIRTLVTLATGRVETGQPVVRLIFILGSVALFTGLSALVYRAPRLRSWYALGQIRDAATG